MKQLVVLPLLLALIVVSTASALSYGERVLVVVTVYPLKFDVSLLSCGNVEVYSIVPAGVDPHEYQLTSRDAELVRQANLIVSTGHTHFELEIAELAKKGELKGVLVDALEVEGLLVRENPVTGKPNYHMPIRDPVNYLVFLVHLTRVLAKVDPANAACYYEKAQEAISTVLGKVLVHRNSLEGLVVADKPHVQYAVEWLGLRVAWILKYEEEVSLAPESIEKALNLLNSGSIVAVAVTDPPVAQESSFLLEEAQKRGIPVIRVPFYNGTLDALLYVSQQAAELQKSMHTQQGLRVQREAPAKPGYGAYDLGVLLLASAASFVAGLAVAYFVLARWRK